MYGIFTYICFKFMLNVGKYTIPMDPLGLQKITIYSNNTWMISYHLSMFSAVLPFLAIDDRTA